MKPQLQAGWPGISTSESEPPILYLHPILRQRRWVFNTCIYLFCPESKREISGSEQTILLIAVSGYLHPSVLLQSNVKNAEIIPGFIPSFDKRTDCQLSAWHWASTGVADKY